MDWQYHGPDSPLNTRPDRQTGSMAEWKQWVDSLTRYERDQLYPGMHIDLIPAYEKIVGMEEINNNATNPEMPQMRPKTKPVLNRSASFVLPTNKIGSITNTFTRNNLAQQRPFDTIASYTKIPYSVASQTPPEFIDDGPRDPYSPEKSGWHEYETVNLVCPPEFNCGSEQMADFMARFAVPGQDPGQPVINGQISLVVDPRNGIPAGKVRTLIKRFGLEIQNITVVPHILHDGQITRTASGGPTIGWQVRTYGSGNNVIPGVDVVNEWEGPQIFDYIDGLMAAYIRSNI